MVGQRPPAGKLLALVNDRNSRAAHHGCGLSLDVTTKSVRSLPQLEQRNRSSVSGTSQCQAPAVLVDELDADSPL
jgi:hypothetical protein